MDALCYMWDSEIRGALVSKGKPWRKEDLALAVRGEVRQSISCINELLDNGVLVTTPVISPLQVRYGAYRNVLYTIPAGCMYSKRLVRDEVRRAASRDRQSQFRTKHNAEVTPGVTPDVTGQITPLSQGEAQSNKKERTSNLIFSQDTESSSNHGAKKKGWIDADETRRERSRKALDSFEPPKTVAKHSDGSVHKQKPK